MNCIASLPLPISPQTHPCSRACRICRSHARKTRQINQSIRIPLTRLLRARPLGERVQGMMVIMPPLITRSWHMSEMGHRLLRGPRYSAPDRVTVRHAADARQETISGLAPRRPGIKAVPLNININITILLSCNLIGAIRALARPCPQGCAACSDMIHGCHPDQETPVPILGHDMFVSNVGRRRARSRSRRIRGCSVANAKARRGDLLGRIAGDCRVAGYLAIVHHHWRSSNGAHHGLWHRHHHLRGHSRRGDILHPVWEGLIDGTGLGRDGAVEVVDVLVGVDLLVKDEDKESGKGREDGGNTNGPKDANPVSDRACKNSVFIKGESAPGNDFSESRL